MSPPRYYERLRLAIAAIHAALPGHGNGTALIAHEASCSHPRGGHCTCRPQIAVVVNDGSVEGAVFHVDAAGAIDRADSAVAVAAAPLAQGMRGGVRLSRPA